MKKLAIFASGSGSNAERLVEYFRDSADISISLILCNNPQAGVIQRAERLQIPLVLFDKAQFKSGEVVRILQEEKIDWVILAGFLWLIPSHLIEAFPDKIVNIHPSLLPKYGGKGMYGHFVHEAVVANQEKESGITIHLVNEHYDEGAIVFQAAYPVVPSDTPDDVAKKGQVLEHLHFPIVVEKLVRGAH